MKQFLFFLTTSMLVGFAGILSSCDPIPAGLQTHVEGIVIDSVHHDLVMPATVVIEGALIGLDGSTVTTVATSLSDLNGAYSIDFVTDGKYNQYRVRVQNNGDFYYINHPGVSPGGKNKKNVKAIETARLSWTISIHSPTPRMYAMRAGSPYHYEYPFLDENQIFLNPTTTDTTLLLALYPKQWNYLSLSYYEAATAKSYYYRDSLYVDLERTVSHTTVITTDPKPAGG